MSVETIQHQNQSNTMEEETTKDTSSITTIPQSPSQNQTNGTSSQLTQNDKTDTLSYLNTMKYTKTRQYLEHLMQNINNIPNTWYINNQLIYVPIPDSIQDFKHDSISNQVKNYLNTLINNDDDNGINKRMQKLVQILSTNFKNIYNSIQYSITYYVQTFMNYISSILSRSIMNWDLKGMFYLINNNDYEYINNPLGILCDNLILSIQRSIIVKNAKSKTGSKTFNIENEYKQATQIGGKQYIRLAGLRDDISNNNGFSKSLNDGRRKQKSSKYEKTQRKFSFHSFFILGMTKNQIIQQTLFNGKEGASALAHLIKAKVIPDCVSSIWVCCVDKRYENGRNGKFSVSKQNITWSGGKLKPDIDDEKGLTKYLIIYLCAKDNDYMIKKQ
ncbi:hypothetical protein EDI_088480 [Entamoeba dispar SAW760]|uniref:Uncharacterized protein n=1 Tax=Entamoeba dispar (strain ATCC PRA-260 / SAW760) TaxID=370354 RepID=B0E8Q2_ENTDS|nr:uncharacterized protein EDI_088480 [Entamoeba dispar SAW760]EDR29088.1 hypothetical protein EDI_088480 [Entamoeba dispar SAW760]|eukprot:EDR29088.1 hypothetical protein EDI_088480 [Entamoeba dispar SAW760]